jgi:signal transduction histidine kinase
MRPSRLRNTFSDIEPSGIVIIASEIREYFVLIELGVEMNADPYLPKALAGDDSKDNARLDRSLQQLQDEISERKRLEEEVNRLNSTLELRLKESLAEVAALKNELRHEKHRHTEEQKEIHLLNENLAQQKNALAMVNRELESFSYSISHDLRAPLRHLVGFSGALLEDYAESLDTSAKGYLDCIVRAGHKMETLIEALLKLSRIARQELKIASVDLTQMARECAATLKESDPGRSVVFSIADELSARGDAPLLRAALENLLANAWKYTVKKETAIIELGRKEEGDATIFYLRDNGAGFDMRYADKLFGPFQRMHSESEFEGTGIGLATVQRIIHRHGGKIWADAAVDGGATFFFTLSE